HRRPLVLIHKESFATRMEAENREKQIKSYKGGQAFKRLIDGRSSRPAAGPPPHHIIPSGIFEQTMKPGPGWVFLSPEIRDI
ncbi:MAG: hypothetical protein K9N38_10365, partial [Candidatus Marinimicrobia bacterium]|nr:hypothetical protein [Candidatus Neomarinimicrobiota bacterium]